MVTLLTDFGYIDAFAGVMKGVIKRICADAEIVDLTHGIPPQDVFAGAVTWQSAYRYFPAGTIHVGVVDPGVGSERRAIAVEAGESIFVCPDNGLLTFIADEIEIDRVVSLENAAYRLPTSRTFHGRDVFAPAAAYLATGVDPDEFGPHVDDIVRLHQTKPTVDNDFITAHIVYFDTFGNVYTDLTEERFRAWGQMPVTVSVREMPITGPVEAYAEVEAGKALALFASHGRLEIAVRNGSARATLGLEIGDRVRIEKGGVP